MGQRLVKQKNGLYAIWSTIVDDYILLDATEQEVKESFERTALIREQEMIEDHFARLRGERGGYFTKPLFSPETALKRLAKEEKERGNEA